MGKAGPKASNVYQNPGVKNNSEAKMSTPAKYASTPAKKHKKYN